MKRIFKLVAWVLGSFLGLGLLAFVLLLVFGTYSPPKIQTEPVVSAADTPTLTQGQKIKVLSWNIQYLAGKNYVFFYDVLDGSGKDWRPSPRDIAATAQEVVRVIREENPDIILLQEVDKDARKTDYEDQLAKLLSMLPQAYKAHTACWYWWNFFLPHPMVMGATGMRLAVISKYRLSTARRLQLPLMRSGKWYDFIYQRFNFKRAILEVRLPVQGGRDLVVMNTHLDAFAQGSTTMQEQVAFTRELLDTHTRAGDSWVIGGDFNLLPSALAYQQASPLARQYYQPDSELKDFFTRYQAVPSAEDATGSNRAAWRTHFPNQANLKAPDRTIDYLFLSPRLTLGQRYVRQGDTWRISDHLPIIAEITIMR